VVIVEGEGAVLEVNVGHFIVPVGTVLHSCAKVSELIEMWFEVVSVVDGGMDVFDVGPRASRGRRGLGVFWSHWFEWHVF